MEFGIHGNAGEELNAFVGRECELSELRQLASDARALTLCGAGGIGKTRLALRLAAELAGDFPDGTWFVDLSDLQQPDLVASRIASVIGVLEEPGRPLLATLADALRPRRMLVVLDNCEHLIDACAQVCQRLLASSAGLQMIATSREPLRVAAETVWQVPPMSMPAPADGQDAELMRADALRLFADRAGVVKPDFELGPASLGPVAAICRAVDGLPLAIELAAAWVTVLTVEQIAARLGDRFRLLSSPGRMAPARHRTLRAAIDWSHDLLSPQEKVLLRRLAIFAGWPLEMAEQVCAGQDSDDELAAGDVLNLLSGLADKSLVVAEAGADGRIRYRMLDTIREYAAAQLDEAGETERLRARFRGYAVREVEQLALIGMAIVPAPWSVRVEVFRRFEDETANLRQLLSWCLASGDAESGLRICLATRPVWIVQGSFAEGAAWMDAFLDLREAERAGWRARLGPGRARPAGPGHRSGRGGQAGQGGTGVVPRAWPGVLGGGGAEPAGRGRAQAGQIDEAEAQAAEAMAIASGCG